MNSCTAEIDKLTEIDSDVHDGAEMRILWTVDATPSSYCLLGSRCILVT